MKFNNSLVFMKMCMLPDSPGAGAGRRNNNPGNRTGVDSVFGSGVEDVGHHKWTHYRNLSDGYAGNTILLLKYLDGRFRSQWGLNGQRNPSITAVIVTWCPPGDQGQGYPHGYIAHMCRETGLAPNERIPITYDSILSIELAKGKYDSGIVNRAAAQDGVRRALSYYVTYQNGRLDTGGSLGYEQLQGGSWQSAGYGGGFFGGVVGPCPIDFLKAKSWCEQHCFTQSNHQCAEYVKKALMYGAGSSDGLTGGRLKYYTGNGFENQEFCAKNGFVCIADFVPTNGHPRASVNKPIEFGPRPYAQQMGDVCLMSHAGGVGHMAWAAGFGLNDWVSDFWQRPPGQQPNCGPYCYVAGVTRVQIWRHQSVLFGMEGYGGINMMFERIKNALRDAEIPDFVPVELEQEEILPDDVEMWVGYQKDEIVVDRVDPFEAHPDKQDVYDQARFLEQKQNRIRHQQELGMNVDMNTNVLITGPHEKK